MRDQFTFYRSFGDAIKRIKKKTDRADAYDAICNYALYGTEPDMDSLSDAAAIAYALIRPNLDASRRKSENRLGKTKQQQNENKRKTSQEQSGKEGEREYEREKEYENEYYNPLPPFCDSPELQSAFDSWLKYKAEKHQSYKPQGLKSLVTQIQKHADIYGSSAVANLIESCMAANWQGIIWEKLPSDGQEREDDDVI